MAKHKRKAPAWLNQPLYLAIRSLMAMVTTPPVGVSIEAARALGRQYASLPMARKRIARAAEHIELAFPGMPEEERQMHARRAFEHLFMLGIETAYAPRLLTRDGWANHVRVTNLSKALDILVAGTPVVLITGHCGNWELLGYVMAQLGFPLHALYRPLDLKPLDNWLRQTRQAAGMVLLDKFGAARAMPRLMAEGAPISFIADQNAGDRGLFVPFFNRLASTYKSIGLMALKFNAPVVCGQARRLTADTAAHRESDDEQVALWEQMAVSTSGAVRGGLGDAGGGIGGGMGGAGGRGGFARFASEPFRYQIEVVDIITPDSWKDHPDPLFYITARYRRALEEMVRRAPEQNLWLHRYWKSRPRHERQGKPFPDALRDKLRTLPWMTEDDIARIEEHSRRDTLACQES